MTRGGKRTHQPGIYTNNSDLESTSPPARKNEFMLSRRRAYIRRPVQLRTRGLERFLGNVDTFRNEVTNVEFISLNKQVLKDITAILECDPCADLGDIIFQYESFIGEINEFASSFSQQCSSSRNPWLGRRNTMRDIWADARLRKNYRNIVFGTESRGVALEGEYPTSSKPQPINAMYEALCAMFDCTIEGRRNKDSLSQLLDASFQQGPHNETVFSYVRIEDIIKSKGNSIKGPKREDIGRYNRKLFDMQNDGLQGHPPVRISVNPRFFDELVDIVQTSEIIRCESCVVSYFHGSDSYEVGEFLLVIHRANRTALCTIKNEMGLLFSDMESSSIYAMYFAGSANILFLYYDTFILYNLVFASIEAASSVYEAFFVK